jgi:monoamine oxidase
MTHISSTPSTFPENKTPKVVVVGAGLAGLTTAYRLRQNGADVHVYEAHNRVGGRVFSAHINSKVIELGGQSIKVVELGGQNITDGGKAKNFHRLVKEFELELIGRSINVNFSYFTGEKLIPLQQLMNDRLFDPEALKKQLDDLVKRSKNMREILNGILDQEDPLYKALEVRLTGYEGGPLDELSPFYVDTLYHMLLGGVTAVHQVEGEERNYVHFLQIKGGNSLLPEKMARILDDRLHLNTPLKRVSKDSKGSFVLTFQNDKKIEADILILAIPCSVFDDIVFEEEIIPLERLEMIRSVRYGTNSKIILPFSEVPATSMVCINDHVMSYYDVITKTITLYCTGALSQFTNDTILEPYSQCKSMIENGFGDPGPSCVVPTYAKDQAFGTYEGPVGYSWPNDPYVKGSYAYIAHGQETALTAIKEEQEERVKTLFAPVDQKLYFAGEHTSILLDVPGTMEAACESGERAARMILKTLK